MSSAGLDWAALLSERSRHVEVEFGAVLDLAPEAIQLWDATGRLVLANRASTELFGRSDAEAPSHDELYGDCLRENGSPFPADDLPVARILASGRALDEEMVMMRSADDRTRWLRLGGQPIADADGALLGALVRAADVTDFIAHEQQLEHLASYDGLTQLPNRLLLAERMQISLARCRRAGDMVAVCMLDLDGFKPVNDSLGHKAGDELLREVAIRLQESIRGDDTVARVGGDEFALLLCGIHKVAECEQSLTRILTRIAQPYQISGQTVRIGASAGIALFPGDGADPNLLLADADAALYQAKQAGKHRFHFFDRKLDQRLQANRGLLRKIGKAVEDKQFVLYYQPIVNCRLGRVEAVEALIRWRHPILGQLAPTEFLPLIEQDDLATKLGEWVIAEALRQIAAWHETGIDLSVGINIAGRHLRQPEFAERLAVLLAAHPAEIGRRLQLEIAESTAMEDFGATAEALRQCREMGIDVALDNFGIGFTSLQHLKRLIMETIKIDQSFIQGMLDAPEDLAIVGGVVGFAAPFGCRVVAEGAETIEHLLTLLELGCDTIQGFSLARPMPAEKLETWLKAFEPDPLWRLSSSVRPTRDHFELLLAEANHRAWLTQAINQHRRNHDTEAAVDDRDCPFGIWLRKPGTQHFRKHAEFRDIERLHHAIHQLANRIGADYRDGDIKQAQADEERLLEEHLGLLSLLRALRIRLSGDASSSQKGD